MGIEKTHPLKVEEVFLEGLSGLSLLALVDYIRVFFVAAALVVFAAMSLPVTKTHPAEVCQVTQDTHSWTPHYIHALYSMYRKRHMYTNFVSQKSLKAQLSSCIYRQSEMTDVGCD